MNYALIFAGGKGTRMRMSNTPKQFMKVDKKEILIHTIEIFEQHEEIDKIIVVVEEEYIGHVKKMIMKYNINKVVSIVSGGDSALESQFNGIMQLKSIISQEDKEAIVLIHDGVRPLVSKETISKNIYECKQKGSAVTVSEAIETTVVLSKNDTFEKIFDRSRCMLARAPQTYNFQKIYQYFLKNKDNLTAIDSSSMLFDAGEEINVVYGNPENIKITTDTDFYLFESYYLKNIKDDKCKNEG